MDNSRQTGHETNCNKLNRRSSTYTNTYRWENGPTIAFLFIFEFIFLNKQNPTNNTVMLYTVRLFGLTVIAFARA